MRIPFFTKDAKQSSARHPQLKKQASPLAASGIEELKPEQYKIVSGGPEIRNEPER
ncbi:hypothetical protein [Duganella radicis]|uniref:Uncharacterized protein n=1 Tax=Duganella radicis TaxID=551988 RepID=A0A6L6PNG0_9BURK|nr:hypothetical protein [Duganella radicis]MTV40670.1 hypothetical protein [Duganella radicis]